MADGIPVVRTARRTLTGKRADTVHRLTAAAIAAIDDVGYSAVTVQMVAERAGVTRATAYIYFSSKDHLIAEVYWAAFSEQTTAPDAPTAEDRAIAVMRQAAMTLAQQPRVARAAYRALLSEDPDVERMRLQIGKELRRRLADALELGVADPLVDLLDLVYTGAIMRAGSGHITYDDAVTLVEDAARRVLDSHRPTP